ncbi:MAG TPA: hypothetical protein VMT95_12685 [Candidatus Binatia bacterium]|nr:hypothetical protein [Candidatus Binatia bacterium]
MLHAVRTKTPLAGWRAQLDDDLGLMLLEMIAYVCDGVSFYDEVIADECYVRTARLPASLRRLVARLGYIAHPATGSGVHLVAFADGRLPVTIPRGTAFRSGSFGSNPPQVFELDADTSIHPLNNSWTVVRPTPTVLTGPTPTVLLAPADAAVQPGDLLLVAADGVAGLVVTATTVVPSIDDSGARFVSVTVDQSIPFTSGDLIADVTLSIPTRRAALWGSAAQPPDPPAISIDANMTIASTLVLDRVNHSIKANDTIILAAEGSSETRVDFRRFLVTSTTDVTMHLPAVPPTTITNTDSTGKVLNSWSAAPAPPPLMATQLTLDANIDDPARIPAGAPAWAGSTTPSSFTVNYGLRHAGTVVAAPKPTLSPTDSLTLTPPVEAPFQGSSPSKFVLCDVNGYAAEITGTLTYSSRSLALDAGVQWSPDLNAPIQLYGNALSASRGQTVVNEILGSGDGSQANQAFTLAKSPLTYFATPSATTPHGFTSTLQIFVAKILWFEVPNFFVAAATDQVYIVRQDDAGNSIVTFGDGANGARLPTGDNNVVANYRYGAGAADAPALSVRQLARPVQGLRSVRNPLEAFGGSDSDPPTMVRTLAPRSALLLGRSISIDDMQVVAVQTPGVLAASTQWAWSPDQQRPLVQVWLVGDPSVAPQVRSRLAALSDPTVVFAVDAATAVTISLALQVSIDPRHRNADVQVAITSLLTGADAGDTGILLPQNCGVSSTLFFSWLYEQILTVPGAQAVTGLLWNGTSPSDYGANPGDGAYFDFTTTPASVTCSGGL